MTTPTLTDVVVSLSPNHPAFYYEGNTITEYDSQEYARNREAEYPSIADQLDDIYHNGIDAWKATIKATKDKYPKE